MSRGAPCSCGLPAPSSLPLSSCISPSVHFPVASAAFVPSSGASHIFFPLLGRYHRPGHPNPTREMGAVHLGLHLLSGCNY